MNKNTLEIEVHLDMDGVLADFDGRVDSEPELKALRESLKAMSANLKQKIGSNTHYKDLDLMLKGPQADPDLHRLKSKLKNTKARVFGYASNIGFFVGLDKMVDADELFLGVEKLLNGKKPHILTAPLTSCPTCVYEKQLWVDTYYKDRYEVFRAEKDKHKYAHARSVLIDDTPKKIRAFQEAGGIGILHTSARESLAELESVFINNFGKNVKL